MSFKFTDAVKAFLRSLTAVMAKWKLLRSAVFGGYEDKIFLKSQRLRLSSSYIIFTGKGQVERSTNELALSSQKAFLMHLNRMTGRSFGGHVKCKAS